MSKHANSYDNEAYRQKHDKLPEGNLKHKKYRG